MIYVRKLLPLSNIHAKSVLLAATAFAIIGTATPGIAADKSPAELVEIMKKGGNVIFIRHATTEKDYADQIDAKMGDCSTQRTLSEAGWKEAKAIGAAFKAAKIPVDAVFSSQYCRAWQTADLAFGEYTPNADLNFEPAEEYTKEQTAAMKERVTPHLSAKPKAGTNTVLVGHDDPFDAATGIYPEPMGVVFVVEPMGDGKFKIHGSIKPDQWPSS